MDALKIQGGTDLVGEVQVFGSKTASLAVMAAALLASGESVLGGAPNSADVRNLGRVLEHMGAKVSRRGANIQLNTGQLSSQKVPSELTSVMRASILVLGPLLARFGYAEVSMPGGCAIGTRPIDQHLKGLKELGASVMVKHGYIVAHAYGGLHGAKVTFDIRTVTGTANLMLAASLADGITELKNASQEPELRDLAACLISMGAFIEGVGTDHIIIRGCKELNPYTHTVTADPIECGTLLVAGALAGNPLTVKGCGDGYQVASVVDKLRAVGARVEVNGNSITVYKAARPQAVDLLTGPYPGFPTDMQAQFMALLSVAEGTSVVTETVWSSRFTHAAELSRLGANITVVGDHATIHGVPQLFGSTVVATDIRAGACLVLAGLIAEGATIVRCIYHMDRGYERLDHKLGTVGAHISRFKES
jgi:UDP-N-acetylglucosamine 1-carboxyvinyltransferase